MGCNSLIASMKFHDLPKDKVTDAAAIQLFGCDKRTKVAWLWYWAQFVNLGITKLIHSQDCCAALKCGGQPTHGGGSVALRRFTLMGCIKEKSQKVEHHRPLRSFMSDAC